jgi:cobalamin biosynthesis protein CobC
LLEHGGRLRAAAEYYGISLNNWLDLSTGINPNGWQVPSIPADCWQRLPEHNDDLLTAAQHYYRNEFILPVAGSQAAIQALPLLRKPSKVGILCPAYAEHAYSWQQTGHTILSLSADAIDDNIADIDVLILINPNNPSGHTFTSTQINIWHQQLKQRAGWLIIDEAFIDTCPELSFSAYPVSDGLIILRSIGKFFGLAGIRCGFVISTPDLLHQLADKLGPWTISHPSRHVAKLALEDHAWQHDAQVLLRRQGYKLHQLLSTNGLTPSGGCDLFQWVVTEQAEEIHKSLAKTGILTRLFSQPASIRFGLPGKEQDWERLAQALPRIYL